MRPPTPKQGQRVALERVGFIWKRFEFLVESYREKYCEIQETVFS